MTGTRKDARSSSAPEPSAERTAQTGSIDRNAIQGRPLEGSGFELPRDTLGFRICYICYDEEGERICNEIPCPSDVASEAASSVAPSRADAAGIALARNRKGANGSDTKIQFRVRTSAISGDPVIDRSIPGSIGNLPRDVNSLEELCYMCHEHQNGEMICHIITCP